MLYFLSDISLWIILRFPCFICASDFAQVRELSGVTLGGLLHCGYLKIDDQLMVSDILLTGGFKYCSLLLYYIHIYFEVFS